MKKRDIIIGIDPDVDKSGVAVIQRSTMQVSVKSVKFSAMTKIIEEIKAQSEELGKSLLVVVESSWLISHNWHTGKKQSVASVAKTGYNVGRNHQVGMMIVEFCRELGLEVIEQIPLKKCWKGTNGKISHEEISYFIPGLPNQTNSEERDALLLAWNEAGLPIRIKI